MFVLVLLRSACLRERHHFRLSNASHLHRVFTFGSRDLLPCQYQSMSHSPCVQPNTEYTLRTIPILAKSVVFRIIAWLVPVNSFKTGARLESPRRHEWCHVYISRQIANQCKKIVFKANNPQGHV